MSATTVCIYVGPLLSCFPQSGETFLKFALPGVPTAHVTVGQSEQFVIAKHIRGKRAQQATVLTCFWIAEWETV